MRRKLVVLLLVASFASAVPASAGEGVAGTLTGAWRLNRSASDLAGGPGSDDTGRPGLPPPGRGGRGGGGFGGGFGGPGGGFGRGEPAAEDREAMKDRMERIQALMEPVERLTITGDARRIVIVDGEGRSERLVPDGKKEQHLVGNVQAEMKTVWKEGRLVSEISLGRGLAFTRTIAVETVDGTRRLTISIAPKGGGPGGRRPPSKRVYEGVE